MKKILLASILKEQKNIKSILNEKKQTFKDLRNSVNNLKSLYYEYYRG